MASFPLFIQIQSLKEKITLLEKGMVKYAENVQIFLIKSVNKLEIVIILSVHTVEKYCHHLQQL